MAKTALIAIGGNSLIHAGQRGTIDEQLANAHATAKSIVRMVEQGWNIVIVAEVLHTYIPGGSPQNDLFGIGSMPHSGMPGPPCGPALRSTST